MSCLNEEQARGASSKQESKVEEKFKQELKREPGVSASVSGDDPLKGEPASAGAVVESVPVRGLPPGMTPTRKCPACEASQDVAAMQNASDFRRSLLVWCWFPCLRSRILKMRSCFQKMKICFRCHLLQLQQLRPGQIQLTSRWKKVKVAERKEVDGFFFDLDQPFSIEFLMTIIREHHV